MKRFRKITKPTRVARLKRHLRLRKKLLGSSERPRLSVFRSEKHIYAQVIDDLSHKTLCQVSTLSKELKLKKGYTTEAATKVGETIAKKALANKIDKIVFDVGGHKYHGRIKALAEAARKGGLQF